MACKSIYGPNCSHIKDVTGTWVPISSSSGESSITYTYGVTHQYVHATDSSWGTSTTVTAEAGFEAEFPGGGASGKISVSEQASRSVAKGYATTFASTTEETYTYKFGPGQVWQWQFTVIDPCGSTTVMGKDLRLTAGIPASPCCIPGWEKDITNPYGGGCVKPSDGPTINLCDHM